MRKSVVYNSIGYGLLTFLGILLELLISNDFCISKLDFWLYAVLGSFLSMIAWGIIILLMRKYRSK